MTSNQTVSYDWVRDIEPYVHTMQPVQGGYTLAKRGVVTLADGSRVFVKIAEGATTKKWLRKEIIAHQRLNKAGYPFIPDLLSYNDSYSAMAVEFLEHASFENTWDKDKLAAILNAQTSLKQYADLFTHDPDFTLESVVGLDAKWPVILQDDNLSKIHARFKQLGVDLVCTKKQLQSYEHMLDGWNIADTTLVHQDSRADNFGYNPYTKQGKLVDWNWLCLGDESLDRTPLFVNMYISGFDPYVYHPTTYDPKMLVYLVSFWLERILSNSEDSSDISIQRSLAQATSVRASIELLERGH